MSEDQGQELSREGIGGSEIAAALGLSPYQSPLEVWITKTAVAEEDTPAAVEEHAEAKEWGSTVEPALRRWYERRAGVPIWCPPRSLFHPTIPWMRATPDGIAISGPPAPPSGMALFLVNEPQRDLWDHGFEAKNTNWRQAHRWGEPGSDDVPLEHILQCQQGMCVTGLASWRVVATVGGQPPAVYRIARDDELIEQMVVGGTAFWQYVVTKTPPPIDASPAWATYLAKRYPFAIERPAEATAHQEQLAARLRDVRQRQNAFAEIRGQLENELKAAIGHHSGLKTLLGLISWRPSRPARGVDYKAAFFELTRDMSESERLALEEAFMVERAAARPFNVPRKWLLAGHEGEGR